MFFIVVWYNQNKKKYYYNTVKGYYKKYYAGYKNQYGHEVILVIPLKSDVFYRKSFLKKVLSHKKVLMRFISFLQNIEKRI